MILTLPFRSRVFGAANAGTVLASAAIAMQLLGLPLPTAVLALVAPRGGRPPALPHLP